MSAGGDYSRLHLRVKCFAEIGQFVGVQGFGLTKGDDHAIKLVTTPEAYPIWFTPTATPIVLPRGELVNYKYCLIEDGQVKAKEHVSNPRLLIPEEEDLVVEDEFRINETESKDVLDESSSARYKAESEKVDIRKVVGSTISKLFIVCYHLPVVISRTNHPDKPFDIEWAESLIARSAQGSISNNVKTIWIGTISIKDLTPAEKGVVTVLLRNMDCIPVFLDDQIASSAYYGFCKTIMWPVFHNVDQLDQIHAAWNLPEIQQESGQNNILQTLQKAYNPLDSPSSRNQSRKQRSQSSLEAESRVLEWNKKEEEYHESYKKVNQIFANTLLEIVQKTDVVWVHDYHLMLVPAILRAAIDSEKVNPSKVMNVNNKYKDVKIIFFLHIPFPTSQIFRTLPESIELLQSMAAADLVGFHAFDHARHFLNAARRLLGLRSHTRPGGMLTVSVKDREVIITMSHVSIETEFINEHLNHPETLRRVEELQQKYAGKKIILGIDVCQRLSGIALKMFAMEKLLSDYLANNPGNNNGIVLIQRSIRQGSRKEDEETTANDIRKLVSHLNTKFRRKIAAGGTSTKSNLFQSPGSNDSATSEFGSAPVSVKWDPSNTGEDENDILIDYAEVGNFKGLPIHERIALYLVSDIFLLTCIREGLNLLPLEYIYSRRNLPRGGVVIASEFSTCSNLLNGALKVNPFSPANVSDTILQALSLSNKDCDYRRQRDLPFIESHPSSKWTKNIVDELEQLRTQSGHGRTTLKKYPAQLNINSMLDAYANAAKEVGITPKGTRVFVFDYGGTLLVKEKFDIYMKQSLSAIGSGRKPSETTMNTLKKLSEDPLNIVIIVTGLSRKKLGNIFQDFKNVTLATSNGLVYSLGENLREVLHPRKPHLNRSDSLNVENPVTTLSFGNTTTNIVKIETEDDRVWEYIPGNIDWKAVNAIAEPILTKFTFRTNGTCISSRFPGIGWSYFGADPEWGSKQANQLTIELEAALAKHDVKITTLIPGSIEIVPTTLKKGNVVSLLLNYILACRAGRLPAMLTIIGDEDVDDGMFEAAFNLISESPAAGQLHRLKTFAITVGKRYCPANFYVNDVSDVEAIFKLLTDSK